MSDEHIWEIDRLKRRVEVLEALLAHVLKGDPKDFPRVTLAKHRDKIERQRKRGPG